MEPLRLITANTKSVKLTHVKASRDVAIIAIKETFQSG
jgi:hypothetical protein